MIVEINGIKIRCAEKQTSKTVVRRIETILIPASMKDELMDMLHHHPAHGHRGGLATYRILSDHYYWPGMHTAIRQVVASCQTCNARRSRDTFTPYKSRPLPTQCFQQISLDFAGPFGPNIKGSHYKYCLVIVDQLSRFPILVPCKANNAQVVINALQNRVYADYGLPESIILDRAGSLKGNQMRAHLEAYGISPEFVAADNHRANGLAE